MKNIDEYFTAFAAEFGRRGGKVSRRRADYLRRVVLEAICKATGSRDNRAVMDYWQTHHDPFSADNSEDDTPWFKYSLWVKCEGSDDPGLRYREKCEPWDRIQDKDYVYHYYDLEADEGKQITALRIKQAMARIRKADKRLKDRGVDHTGAEDDRNV